MQNLSFLSANPRLVLMHGVHMTVHHGAEDAPTGPAVVFGVVLGPLTRALGYRNWPAMGVCRGVV